jgi:hypothetical protein
MHFKLLQKVGLGNASHHCQTPEDVLFVLHPGLQITPEYVRFYVVPIVRISRYYLHPCT